jgi:PAS domain S-box-containing protein
MKNNEKSKEELITALIELEKENKTLRKYEETLKRSEAKFHSLYSNMVEGSALHELMYNDQGVPEDYMIIEVNPAFEKHLGISRSDIIGKTSKEAYGLSEPPYFDIYSRVALSGKSEGFEAYFATLQKHFSISVYCPAKGSFATIFQNITESKRTEVQLRESALKYRVLAESMKDVVWTFDPKAMKFLYVSPSCKAVHGFDSQDVIGKSFDIVLPRAEVKILSAKILQTVEAIERGETNLDQFYINEFEQLNKNGDLIWTEVITKYLINENSGLLEIHGVTRDISKRKRAEETLRQSEEKIRLLLNSTAEAIYGIDTNGNCTFCNRACLEQLGYQRAEDLLGKNMHEQIHYQNADGTRFEVADCKIFKAFKSGGFTHEDKELLWKADGTCFPAEYWSYPQYHEGKITGAVVTFFDITERKNAEEELVKTNAYLENLINYANAPIIVWDPHFRITRFNHAFEFLTGLTEPEVLGKSLEILFPPALKESSMKLIRNTSTGERWETVEIEIQHISKATRTVLWNSATLFTPDGKIPIATIAQGNDITMRKQLEKTLHDSEAKYRLLTEFTADVIWVLNLNTSRFSYISPSVFHLRGLTSEEAMKEALEDSLTPESIVFVRKAIEKNIQDFIKHPDVPRHYINEIQQYCKDGQVIWVEVSTQFRYNSLGEIEVVGVSRNNEERKKAEREIELKNDELQRLNAQKDKFFSIIAHDLKSPFNSIMGFSQRLIEQVGENNFEKTKKYAEIILNSSGRAMELLMNLMDWSRSQTGRIEFNPEYLELLDLVNEITMLFDDIAGQKTIVIKKELSANTIVFADKAMLSTVFRNLISNSIKFTMPGGEILISAVEKRNELIISVQDSGIGIPDDRIGKLFNIDENYSTPGTHKERGTGLGLILCKEFVDKHGGKIKVESKLGQGSHFTFTIPINGK